MNKKKYQKPEIEVYPMKRPSLLDGTSGCNGECNCYGAAEHGAV
jgi:hypothetical protein